MLSFIIPGQPQGKGRPRFTKRGHTYTPEKTKAYEREIASAGLIAAADRGDDVKMDAVIQLMVIARFKIPKSWTKARREAAMNGPVWHTCKPDGVNVLKVIQDALNGILWNDDSQIAYASIMKVYSDEPCLDIQVLYV